MRAHLHDFQKRHWRTGVHPPAGDSTHARRRIRTRARRRRATDRVRRRVQLQGVGRWAVGRSGHASAGSETRRECVAVARAELVLSPYKKLHGRSVLCRAWGSVRGLKSCALLLLSVEFTEVVAGATVEG